MERKSLCKLQRDRAAELITIYGMKDIFYRRGIWNPYEKVSVQTAVEGAMLSGYGADVSLDEATGAIYVSCPVDSDMW